MRVTFAHICDYATISREGKLSAMGIFDRMFANSVPAVHPVIHLAFELELHPSEVRQPFEIAIKMVNHDGNVVVEIAGQGRIDAAVEGGELVRAPQILALGGLPLPAFGTYSLDIFVNRDHKWAAPLRVLHISEAPQGLLGPGLPQ